MRRHLKRGKHRTQDIPATVKPQRHRAACPIGQILYDRFANALQPGSAERDEMEQVFMWGVTDV
jgi:hypothetical protein